MNNNFKANDVLFTHDGVLIHRYIEPVVREQTLNDIKPPAVRIANLARHFVETTVFRGMIVDLQSKRSVTSGCCSINSIMDRILPTMQSHVVRCLTEVLNKFGPSVYLQYTDINRYVLDICANYYSSEDNTWSLRLYLNVMPCVDAILIKNDAMLEGHSIAGVVVRFKLSPNMMVTTD